jgi:hypothetical protein
MLLDGQLVGQTGDDGWQTGRVSLGTKADSVARFRSISAVRRRYTVQSLLVASVITYQQMVPFFPSGIAIGGWLMLNSYLNLTSQLLPRGLTRAGLLAGIGYVVTVAGFLLGGYQNPLFFIGGLLTMISYPTWAFWLGRIVLTSIPEVDLVPGI